MPAATAGTHLPSLTISMRPEVWCITLLSDRFKVAGKVLNSISLAQCMPHCAIHNNEHGHLPDIGKLGRCIARLLLQICQP